MSSLLRARKLTRVGLACLAAVAASSVGQPAAGRDAADRAPRTPAPSAGTGGSSVQELGLRLLPGDTLALPGSSGTPASHPVRALLETTLFFGLNTAYYWWDADFNSQDWDLRWDWPSWKRKVITFDAVRLDVNEFSTNSTHTVAGTLVYLIARGNHLGVTSSVLLTAGESVLWEYLAEFKEQVSINDMFNNTLGGLAIGEPFFAMSEFFAEGSDNAFNQTLSALFSPMSHLDGWADRDHRRRPRAPDRHGFPTDRWHRFHLYVGMSSTRWADGSDRSETLLGTRLSLNRLTGYGRALTRSGFFGPGRITGIEAAAHLSGQGLGSALFGTRVAIGGYQRQRLRQEDGERLRGSSLVVSLTNTFEYTNRRRPGVPFDQVASFGVAGPSAALSLHRDRLVGELNLEALPTLGMVTSLADERYRLLFGSEGVKTVLANNGYYFAYGLTLRSSASVGYQPFQVGLGWRWDRYGSIEGRDRFQERVTRDFHLVDSSLQWRLWVSLEPRPGSAQLVLAVDRAERSGKVPDVDVSTSEQRATLTLGIAF
jgi:hypothetical protein